MHYTKSPITQPITSDPIIRPTENFSSNCDSFFRRAPASYWGENEKPLQLNFDTAMVFDPLYDFVYMIRMKKLLGQLLGFSHYGIAKEICHCFDKFFAHLHIAGIVNSNKTNGSIIPDNRM